MSESELTVSTLKLLLEQQIDSLEKIIEKDGAWREKIESLIRANYDAHFQILNHAAEAVTQRNVDFVRESVYSAEVKNLRGDVDRIRLDNAEREGSSKTFAVIISVAASMFSSLVVGLAVHFLTQPSAVLPVAPIAVQQAPVAAPR